MTSRSRSILVGTALFLLGLTVGVVGSQRYWFRWALGMRYLEVVSRADMDIVVLSEWRTGHEERARAILEGTVDSAVATVYSSAHTFQKPLPESALKMIQLAKVYRTAFPPPPESSPMLFDALGSVSMPVAEFCSPALQKIMSEAVSRPSKEGI